MLTQLISNYNMIIYDDLSSISEKVEFIKLTYNKFPKERRHRYTFLEIIKRNKDENFISDYLAFLLDISKNGIGNKPLLMLLESANFETLSQYNFNNYKITREWVFINQRRIDLLIVNEEEKIIIGIENKTGTGESHNQTFDYEKSINEEFNEYESILFFLTPNENEKPSSGKFIPITYKKLSGLFSKLQIIDFDEIDSFKFFQDFLLHINYTFINKIAMNKTMLDKAILYAENKNIIEDIEKSYKEAGNRFIDEIKELSIQYYQEHYSDTVWTINFPYNYEWKQIFKNSWVFNGVSVHFEWWLEGKHYFEGKNLMFMIDFEGINYKKLISLAKSQENIKLKVNEEGFSFFPQKRPNAFLFKEYTLNQPLYKMSEIERQNFFYKAYSDSHFAIGIIDNLIEEFKNLT